MSTRLRHLDAITPDLRSRRGGTVLAFHHFGLFLSAGKILETWGFLQLAPAFIWQLPGCQEATVVAVCVGVLNCFSRVQLLQPSGEGL